ncbi:hypothetical protein EUGRSUZ_E00476 [Eucalyptus grandis]|uniref:Uncharacterized protein n=2 Tax=Eucalyptus grandis TaxID=71139 RepID=A0ACC3KSR1_EUCGR|nr:hypothetical protein EUGRSUZ_E00476 [Eucalyptus grandis]
MQVQCSSCISSLQWQEKWLQGSPRKSTSPLCNPRNHNQAKKKKIKTIFREGFFTTQHKLPDKVLPSLNLAKENLPTGRTCTGS